MIMGDAIVWALMIESPLFILILIGKVYYKIKERLCGDLE